MKILIVNDKLIQGGTEIYALNLKEILEKENEVYLLTFDNQFSENIKKINNNKNIINIKMNSKLGKLNKLLFNPYLYKKIRKEVKKINPDKIIINNIFYSPITQIKALKGYELYQIVHDYSVVCPKSTCLKDDMNICNGYKNEKCIKQCLYHQSKRTLIVKLKLTKKMEKLRKKYIKKFISPSEKLNQYLKSYNYDSVCINNPIKIIETNKIGKKKKTKNYIYVGAINENKGIFKFIEAFNTFSKDKNVQLEILGKPSTKEDSEKLNVLIKNNPKIINIGFVQNHEALKKVGESDYIIVPSLWMENYPTTVLEAMMLETFIIGSNRGGIPEMLGNDRGILFDIMNKEDIIEKLTKTYEMEEKKYFQIVTNAKKYVSENNNFENYYKKINVILKYK